MTRARTIAFTWRALHGGRARKQRARARARNIIMSCKNANLPNNCVCLLHARAMRSSHSLTLFTCTQYVLTCLCVRSTQVSIHTQEVYLNRRRLHSTSAHYVFLQQTALFSRSLHSALENFLALCVRFSFALLVVIMGNSSLSLPLARSHVQMLKEMCLLFLPAHALNTATRR